MFKPFGGQNVKNNIENTWGVYPKTLIIIYKGINITFRLDNIRIATAESWNRLSFILIQHKKCSIRRWIILNNSYPRTAKLPFH